MLVLLPVFAIVAVAIKMDSPGPVFFRQLRVGRNGKLFKIFKFRSMVDGASKAGIALTVKGDPRITRLGGFLRNHKVDELPQLFNVLAGSMSFVGPRPEVRDYIDFYTPEQRRVILSMRPGITDYAAILFRDEGKLLAGNGDPAEIYRQRIVPIKYALYERYSREIGLLCDLRIIMATLMFLYSPKDVNWFHAQSDASTVDVSDTVCPKASGGKAIEQSR